jgi:hypothetical protein
MTGYNDWLRKLRLMTMAFNQKKEPSPFGSPILRGLSRYWVDLPPLPYLFL